MTGTDREERGAQIYGGLMGIPAEQVPAAMAARVGAQFVTEVLLDAGGKGWSDPSLTDRERDIATISALVAQGIYGHRTEAHIAAARRDGLDDNALTTLLALLAHYCGYPHASTAMEMVLSSAPEEPA